MPSGTLGQSAPSASTNTTVYTVPSGKVGVFSVNICNRGSTAALVRLAIAATGTPGNSEWVEYDFPVPANGSLERTGLVASASKNVVVFSGSSSLSVNVYGYEE